MQTTIRGHCGLPTRPFFGRYGLLFVAGLSLASPLRPLDACECIPTDFTLEEGVLDSLMRADAVFAGTTVRSDVGAIGSGTYLIWTLVVTEIWKGDRVEDVVEIVSFTSCDVTFRPDTEYVVFAHRSDVPGSPEGSFVAGLCNYTTPEPELVTGFLGPSSPPEPRPFLRGDVDGTGDHTLNDAIVVLDHLFVSAADIGCARSADANDSGDLDVTDPIFVLNHLFQGGPPPPSPFGACGVDPTPDRLRCATVAAACE